MQVLPSLLHYYLRMIKKLFIFFVLIFVLALAGIGLLIGGVYWGYFGDLPTDEDLRSIKNETASLVFSEDEQLIGKFFAKNRTNTALEDLPQHLIDALVATEDARYFDHGGVDYRSLLRVFVKTLLMGDDSAGGGSTLSQQLAKNLYGRNYKGVLSLPVNKVKEAILAARLGEIYSKEEILTLYLNTVPFGENVYGVEAAAGRFFSRKAGELTVEQAAVLVGMLKANTYYNPRLNPENSLRRRNVVLGQMRKYAYLEPEIADSLQALPLELEYSKLSDGPANYFLVQVKREAQKILNEIESSSGEKFDLEKDGLNIHTTLHHQMQLMALDAYREHLGRMQPLLKQHYRSGQRAEKVRKMAQRRLENVKGDAGLKQRELFSWDGFYTDSISMTDSVIHELTLLHAGMIALNPQNGAIKIWVGGIDFRTQPYDQVLAKRQVASAFKPVLYTAALESGIEPCTYLSNDTVVFRDHDNWSPQNYDHSTGGKYSMAGALKKSMNIPSVDLMYRFDRSYLEELWENLGFTTELPEGPSTALGSVDASVLELGIAYSAFANGGKKITSTTIQSITTADGTVLYEMNDRPRTDQIISAQSTILMQQMMQRVVNEGTAASIRSLYGIREELAAKTGTSQDYADAWFGSYTPGLVTVARVGASMPDIHFESGSYGSGSTLALPLVGLTLKQIQADAELKNQVFVPFPELPPALAGIFDCDDYQEPSAIDNFRGLFRAKHTTEERKKRQAARRNKNDDNEGGGLLQRLFRKRK